MLPSNELLTCPECTEKGIESPTFKSPAGLGGHRKVVHGIEGESRSAADNRTRAKRKYKRRTRPLPQPNIYVTWLAEHPGTHSSAEIGAALGAEAARVGKGLSAAKMKKFPVASDGHGNWHYTGRDNLPAVVQTNGHARKPRELPVVNDAEIEFTSIRPALLMEDSKGGVWLAERLR